MKPVLAKAAVAYHRSMQDPSLLRSALLVILALALPPLAASAQSSESQNVRWVDDLDEATRLATESGKPMLLVFR